MSATSLELSLHIGQAACWPLLLSRHVLEKKVKHLEEGGPGGYVPEEHDFGAKGPKWNDMAPPAPLPPPDDEGTLS